MAKKVFDLNYSEWHNFYTKHCKNCENCCMKIGGCCLGDILDEKEPHKTLNDIISECEENEVFINEEKEEIDNSDFEYDEWRLKNDI